MEVNAAVESLPTLVQHGAQDPMIDVGRARGLGRAPARPALPLTYHEYEMGHEFRPRSLSDLSAWLEEKILRLAIRLHDNRVTVRI